MSQPDASLLDWVVRSTRGRVSSASSLRAEWGPWLVEVEGGDHDRVVLKIAPDGDPGFLATEAAAMELARAHDVRAPTLVAVDLTGADAGTFALVRTNLAGEDSVTPEPSTERLRSLGAAAAAFHRVRLAPTTELPRRERHMPWKDLAVDRRAGIEPSTPLLDKADAVLRHCLFPEDDLVFVHGDLWAGNALWDGDQCVGIIDWDAAGAGSYGVDLGSLRFDTALFYGLESSDHIVEGWEAASGRAAENVAYWDVVATLNVEADMSGSVPAMHATGRVDLDGPTMNRRRDQFLTDALERLG